MPDDTITSKLVQRLREHETRTVPVIMTYNQRHGVTRIGSVGPFDEVLAHIAHGIETGCKSPR